MASLIQLNMLDLLQAPLIQEWSICFFIFLVIFQMYIIYPLSCIPMGFAGKLLSYLTRD